MPADIVDTGLLIGQGVTFIGLIVTIIVAFINKKARTPSDDNETIRLGNEFLRGLLEDAKSERSELRKTIEELRQEKMSQESTIERLEKLLLSKDERITAMERLIRRLTQKLHRGELVTLEDVLGFVKDTGAIAIANPTE